MDNMERKPRQTSNPRRKKRSKMQIFKESYLPVLIFALVLILIIWMIVAAVKRNKEEDRRAKEASIAASEASEEAKRLLDEEAAGLMTAAQALADTYDYDGAVKLLDSFSGNIYNYDEMLTLRDSFLAAKDQLVLWEDNNDVVNLSFHVLMADIERAFADKDNVNYFKRDFITTYEFTEILDQLYANNYILVSMDDLVAEVENADGTVSYAGKPLYLPEGKKPLMLTETQVNYYTYMVDDDNDGYADANGSGFASRLIVTDEGEIKCEYVTDAGTTKVGDYDMVPILNSFLEEHPDFSYKGAKAVLAVTGSDGVFGYRIQPEAEEKFGEDYYQEQLDGAKKIIQALRDDGYTIACYSYAHKNYGEASSLEVVSKDLTLWEENIAPILGDCDILVYARYTDIPAYSGERYELLKEAGFRYFYGICTGADTWLEVENDYVRQGRILLSGSGLTSNSSAYKDLFDAEAVVDPDR